MKNTLFLLVILFLCSCTSKEPLGISGCPDPVILSHPSKVATAGIEYTYHSSAEYTCSFAFVCSSVDVVEKPKGATTDHHSIWWTPTLEQAGTVQHFKIQTEEDTCGNSVSQRWSVTVSPPIVIDSFTSNISALDGYGSVKLTAVFHGGEGEIEGVGPVQSEIPVTTPVLTEDTAFRLVVTNEANASIEQYLFIHVVPQPQIERFFASKDTVTAGYNAYLYWEIIGDYTKIVIDPGGADVTDLQYYGVTPSEDTNYTIKVFNEFGVKDTASLSIRTVPLPIIDSFSAVNAPGYGDAAKLLPVFRFGSGYIEGIGPVVSGVPVESWPLFNDTWFELSVENEGGNFAYKDLEIILTGPRIFREIPNISCDRLKHAAELLNDGRVILIGGETGPGYALNTTMIFNPWFEVMVQGPNLNYERSSPSAVKLLDGRVLIVGGVSNNGHTIPNLEIYDPVSNTITLAGNLPMDLLYKPTAELLSDGRVFIVDSAYAEAVLFTPETGYFYKYGYLPGFWNEFATAVLNDGRVLIINGKPSDMSQVYDPSTGFFMGTDSVNGEERRGRFFADTLVDNRVLVYGNGGILDLYYPDSGEFIQSIDMKNIYTGYLNGAKLNDGKILLTGTMNEQAWVFDPSNDTLNQVGSMKYDHSYHTSTTLLDGRVFIYGRTNFSADQHPEIYNP